MGYTKFKLSAIGFFMFLFVFAASAQQISISGIVKDAKDGEPLIGAKIMEKGTTNGTITDIDGNFSFSVASPASIIVVSYIGFQLQEHAVAGRNTFMIELEADAITLQEVVAIGYGSQTKKEITGSIASIKPGEFNQGTVNNVQGLLQGKVAGLNITKDAGGDPTNKNYNVQLRGVGTLTGNAQPLFIIDGVPGGSLNSVAPSDIASIDVLKDGSAAAIYGTRANAGVIIITTKKGNYDSKTGGKAQIEYNGTVQADLIAKRIDMLSGKEYREFVNNPKYQTTNSDGSISKPGVDLGSDTDWISEITRNPAITHTHNLAISGGGSNYHFRSSLNYRNVQGLAKNSNYEEILFKASASVRGLNNKLEVSPDISYQTGKTNWVDHLIFREALNMNPTALVYDKSESAVKYGGYYTPDGFSSYNPVAILNQIIDDGRQSTFLGSVRAELTIAPKLKVSTFLSRQEDKQITGKYTNSQSKFGEGESQNGIAKRSTYFNKTDLIESMLQYINQFDAHGVQAMIGNSYQYFSAEGFDAENKDFDVDNFTYNNLNAGGYLKDGKAGMGSYKNSNKLVAYFARLLYNYNQRYFLSASLRMEGSSKFGPEAHPTLGRYGLFPSISGSWIISEESFMSEVNFVDDLKIRAGYGVTGNTPGDSYRYIDLVGPDTGVAYYENGEFRNPWKATSNYNPYLRWETKHEYNIGLDFVLLKGKLSGTIDAYLRDTKDLLYDARVKTPPYSINSMLANFGRIQNKGIELTLNSELVKTKDFTLNGGIVLAANSNKLVDLTYTGLGADDSPTVYDMGDISWRGTTGLTFTRIEIGEALGQFYGYKYSHVDEATGRVHYFKLQDGVKTANPDGTYRTTTAPSSSDKTYLGSAYPLLTGGFNFVASYKQFDVSTNFRGQIGGRILNAKRIFFEDKSSGGNLMQSAFEGEMAHMKGGQVRMSDYFLEDASFLRLNDVTLGYNFTLNDEAQKYLSQARVYFTCQNAFTLSSYTGVDPEVSLAGLTPGLDGINYYPRQRSFLIGVNFTF